MYTGSPQSPLALLLGTPQSSANVQEKADQLAQLGLGDSLLGRGTRGYADLLGARDALKSGARDYVSNKLGMSDGSKWEQLKSL